MIHKVDTADRAASPIPAMKCIRHVRAKVNLPNSLVSTYIPNSWHDGLESFGSGTWNTSRFSWPIGSHELRTAFKIHRHSLKIYPDQLNLNSTSTMGSMGDNDIVRLSTPSDYRSFLSKFDTFLLDCDGALISLRK